MWDFEDGNDFSFAGAQVYGVPNSPSLPMGANNLPAPAAPVAQVGPAESAAGAVTSAVTCAPRVTAGPVWRQPAFQALLLCGIGVVLIGHASYVAGKV